MKKIAFIISLIGFIGFTVILTNPPFRKYVFNLPYINQIGTKFLDAFYIPLRDGKNIDAEHVITKLHNGMSIIVNTNDRCVCWFLRANGRWDRNETEVLEKIVQKGFHIVEVGSNFGAHTLWMADLVGTSGKIYGVEANPNVSKYLKQSIALNKLEDRITLFEMAASNKAYNGFMVYGSQNIGAGYILPDGPDATAKCQIDNCTPIRVKKLDDMIPDQKIDLLKMDAEGAEYWILEGAQTLLKKNPHMMIMMEWDPNHMKRSHIDSVHFLNTLEKRGLKIWAVAEGGILTPMTYDNVKAGGIFDLLFAPKDRSF